MVAPTPDPSPTGGGGAHFILVQQSFLPPVGEGSRIGELGERTECGGVQTHNKNAPTFRRSVFEKGGNLSPPLFCLPLLRRLPLLRLLSLLALDHDEAGERINKDWISV